MLLMPTLALVGYVLPPSGGGARHHTLPPVGGAGAAAAPASRSHQLRSSAPSAFFGPGATGPLRGDLPEGHQLLPDGREGVILFDGVCNFCNRWVSFVLDNDPEGIFAFASLQSPKGGELLAACGRDAEDLSTFVVIDRSNFYTQSDAALRVGAMLKLPALNVLASAATRVPSPLRDGVYRLVANNRYSILGKDESGDGPSCQLRADGRDLDRFLG